MVNTWNYLVDIVWDHQDDKLAFRLFTTEAEARGWVEHEHKARWNPVLDQFQTETRKVRGQDVLFSLGFEIAMLYKILDNGEVEEADQYQTFADETGNAIGWINQ